MQIKSTHEIKPEKINALIYGESGVGKTFLASTLVGKTIIVSMESGLLSLRGHSIDYIEEINNLDKLKEALTFLITSDYQNIYIDSLTEVTQLFLAYCKEQYPDDKQTLKVYGLLLEMVSAFIKFTRDMNKNVFFTALQKTSQDEYNRRYHVPDLVGSIASKCPQFFDFVFNYQMVRQDEQDTRFLVTQKTSNSLGKDRSGLLDLYEQPNLGLIINKIFGD